MLKKIKNNILVGLSGSLKLAKLISLKTGLKLAKISNKRFANGEILIECQDSIKNKKFFLFNHYLHV